MNKLTSEVLTYPIEALRALLSAYKEALEILKERAGKADHIDDGLECNIYVTQSSIKFLKEVLIPMKERRFSSIEDTTAFFADLEPLEEQEEQLDPFDELVANCIDPQYIAEMMSGESRAQLLSDCPECGGRIEIIREVPPHIICDTCDWEIKEGK